MSVLVASEIPWTRGQSFEGRVETPTGFENMEDQMLRKQILTTHQTMSGRGAAEKDIAAVVTVLVSSEDPRHPIDYAFDGQRGPGASRWIAAQPGEQALILEFDTPQTIRKILVEVEEPEISARKKWRYPSRGTGGRPIANSCVRSTTSAHLGRRSSMKSGQSRPTRSATCSSGSSRTKAARLAALRSPRSPWSDVNSCELSFPIRGVRRFACG